MRITHRRLLTAIGLTLATEVVAVPSVTVVPLGNGCAAYPGFNSETEQSGLLAAVADSTGKMIEGNRVTADMYFTPEETRYGFAIVAEANERTNVSMRCTDGKLQAEVDMGGGRMSWQPIVVSGDPNWVKSLGWSFPEDDHPASVEPYAHYIDGKRVPGIFLGVGNVTTWTFKQNFGGVFGTHYLVRLGAPSPTVSRVRRQFPFEVVPDFAGFVKIGALEG